MPSGRGAKGRHAAGGGTRRPGGKVIALVKSILPRPPDTFIGRDLELSRLALFFQRQRLLLVKGIAGIGKTALSLAFVDHVRRLRPRSPVLYVRCLGGWTLDDVAAEILASGLPFDEAPWPATAALREKLNALVHHLNAADAVLFLDDVHLLSDSQVASFVQFLLAYLSSRVVLVSREDLPLSAVEMMDVYQEKLEGLPLEAATGLVRDLLELHPGEPLLDAATLERLAATVGGHPFLLRLVASLLVTRALDVNRLLAEGAPAEVRACLLGRVVGEIGAVERGVLEVLALARVSVPVDVLAGLAGLADVRPLLASLERKFLLERDAPERVLVHQLLADYLYADMGEARRLALHRSLAPHFHAAGQPQQSFHHCVEGGLVDDATRILADEAARMCSGGQYALLLEDVARLEAMGGVLPSRLRLMHANALSLTGRGEESLVILRALADETEDPLVVADSLASMAGTHLNSGHFGRALAAYEQALAFCGRRSEAPVAFKCLNYTALIRGFRGEIRKSREILKQSLSMGRRLDNRPALAHALRIQATIHCLAEEPDEALPPAHESLRIATAMDSARLACWARYAIALAQGERRESEAARATLEEMLRDGRRFGDTHVQAYAHLELGRLAWDEGRLDDAADSLGASMQAFQVQGDGMGVAMAELHLGMTRFEQGQEEAARRLLLQCAAAARERENLRLEAEALLGLADIGLQGGDTESAQGHAEAARSILDRLDLPWLTAEAAVWLAEIAARRLRWSEARELLASATRQARDRHPVAQRAAHLASLFPGESRRGRPRPGKAPAEMDGFPPGAPGRVTRRFVARVEAALSRKFRIFTAEGETLGDDAEVAQVRAESERLAFFLDVPGRRFVVEGKGDVPIFRRRVLSGLLLVFVRHAGRALSPEELVPLVWGCPYDGESSALELRKAVSRLRDLVEPDRAHPIYLKHHEAMVQGRGRYSFQPGPSFCAILEVGGEDSFGPDE